MWTLSSRSVSHSDGLSGAIHNCHSKYRFVHCCSFARVCMPRRSRRAAVVASNESSTPNTSQQPLNTPQSTTQLSRSKGTDDSVVDTVQNQPDSSTATILAVIPAARSTSSDKQHKSVVFAAEEGTGQQADSSLQSSLTTASKSTR